MFCVSACGYEASAAFRFRGVTDTCVTATSQIKLLSKVQRRAAPCVFYSLMCSFTRIHVKRRPKLTAEMRRSSLCSSSLIKTISVTAAIRIQQQGAQCCKMDIQEALDRHPRGLFLQ